MAEEVGSEERVCITQHEQREYDACNWENPDFPGDRRWWDYNILWRDYEWIMIGKWDDMMGGWENEILNFYHKLNWDHDDCNKKYNTIRIYCAPMQWRLAQYWVRWASGYLLQYIEYWCSSLRGMSRWWWWFKTHLFIGFIAISPQMILSSRSWSDKRSWLLTMASFLKEYTRSKKQVLFIIIPKYITDLKGFQLSLP